MTGINIIFKLSVSLVFIAISAITPCSTIISDRRICFDKECSVPVSLATTVVAYNSNDPLIMSFKNNVGVTVFSKSAGKRRDLWGVEINGKRGYVPKEFLKENKILKKALIHDVPTEEININETTPDVQDVPKVDNSTNETIDEKTTTTVEVATDKDQIEGIPNPSRLSPSYEVVDGTTIPMPDNEAPEERSYSTAVPPGTMNIGEQPVLSVHPNPALDMKFENDANDLSDGDSSKSTDKLQDSSTSGKDIKTQPVQKPEEVSPDTKKEEVEVASSGEESSSKDVENLNTEKNSETDVSSGSTEKPEQGEATDDVEQEIPETNDTSKSPKSENTTTETVSQEQLEEEEIAKVTDESQEEKTINTALEDEKETENNTTVEDKHEKLTNASSEEKKENPTETSVENQEKETIPGTASEQTIAEEEIQKENATLSGAPENSEITNKTIERDSQTEEKTVDEAKVSDDEKIKNIAEPSVDKEAATVAPETPKTNEQTSKNFNEEVETAGSIGEKVETNEEAINVTEDTLAVEGTQEKPQEKPEEKASEVPRSIMSPLFNTLSKLPAVMKEVVSNAIMPGTESASEDPKVEESLNSNEETKDSIAPEDLSKDEKNASDDVPSSQEDLLSKVPDAPEIVDTNDTVNITDDHPGTQNNNDSAADNVADSQTNLANGSVQPGVSVEDVSSGFRQENIVVDRASNINGFPVNRNLLNVGSSFQPEEHKTTIESLPAAEEEVSTESLERKSDEITTTESPSIEEVSEKVEIPPKSLESEDSLVTNTETIAETVDSCLANDSCKNLEENRSQEPSDDAVEDEIDITKIISAGRNYWETVTYLVVTGLTTLLFSLGYYYIENSRRDGHYIGKINTLEKELLLCSKECTMLDDTLKSTKTKLDSIEDESFGSNEMVASLKADLETSKVIKTELEEQVAMLEKELETATEAGLELERMLREILSSNNADNPLAKSVEDLQTRLNAQQAANEALTNSLNLKAQENESLTAELKAMTQKSEQLEVEVTRITEELKHQNIVKRNMEESLIEKLEHFEKQIKDISAEKISLRQQLKFKEMEQQDLLEVVNQMNVDNLDLDQLYNVSRVKAEASQLAEERDELQIKLSEVEGAHQLLEEHVKLINEEVQSLSEQSRLAEKAKRDAETRVEVLSNFFKEKEAQRQKEEAIWLEKQGEVSSTVERLHMMQNEIHNYKQQIEMLKREIVDQEREYKNQIASLETKSHEQWVIARQHERRLEESKAEAGQLRNRLTLIEKNLNDADPEAKLHRLEANGETATSPQLFIGAEASSSPIMFTGSSGVPLPPPPSYLYGPPGPPFMPPPPHGTSGIPPYEVGQRPPPLGGRLSSPPPLHPTNSGRFENSLSPPPPLSPSMILPYGPHRPYPPPFPNDRMHPPPPPPPAHSSILPPMLGTSGWHDETLPPLRNSGFHQPQHHHHPQQQQHHHHHHRDNQQRARNHKGSLHSSGESLDKNL